MRIENLTCSSEEKKNCIYNSDFIPMKYTKLLYIIFIALLEVVSVQAQELPINIFKQMKARSIGPAIMGGRITAIDAVVNNPDIMYVGAASGGVWKSVNGGASWVPIFDNQPNINIGSIAIQQSNPNVLWVGTGEGNPRNSVNMGKGIFKSLDGGKSWKSMGLINTHNIHRIIINPDNPNEIYAGVIGLPWGDHPERGVYKTVNGGKDWEQILYTNEKSGVADMVMDPTNPSKLIVAMWQHRRTPWDFTSGGSGSGLFITHDGGETWDNKGEADGLPKGELGRIGIAISRSMPNRIYAMVEATKNGLYRSDDGGDIWELITDEPSIVTDRPFYYNEIYVDPKNENRVYKLSARLYSSEDGGKNFNVIATSEEVHPDHHALWIHPDNPSLIIDGNDGGLAISRDQGKTWMNPEGVTAGQFYHINVDNEVPYNVYGGLQDNGSWVGPAYTFQNGGIRNSHWQALMLADGFDVVPDAENARYGYAMSQGGNIARYDKVTGGTTFIKPTIEDVNTRLRFNWNTGIAQDPFDPNTIYAGSQFLHKSMDRGMSWETISEDLTLNNPEHHKQDESGGLTIDATNAENHNNILTIAPSTLKKDLIWVGTDDGNIQLTLDGGKSWEKVSKNISKLPTEAWISQITASLHNAGEAFVVANLYRMGSDFAPYIYKTSDYGKTWKRLADEKNMEGYALSFIQDPVEPRLMFAGTEMGLWVSIDDGLHWTKWDHGIPKAVPVMDLAIQKREADLVLGTFGRSVYVLDNIRPLRKIASSRGKVIDAKLVAFETSDVYQATFLGNQGYGKDGANLYQAENRTPGANLIYYIKPITNTQQSPTLPSKNSKESSPPNKLTEEGNIKSDTLIVQIYNEENKLVRTLKELPDISLGVNKINWDLTEEGIQMPSSMMSRRGSKGSQVLPGRFKAIITYAGEKDSIYINILPDPRSPFNKDAAMERYAMLERVNKSIYQLVEASNMIAEARESTEIIIRQLKNRNGQEYGDLHQSTLAIQDSLNNMDELLVGKSRIKQGLGKPYMLTAFLKLQEANSYISQRQDAPTKTEVQLIEQAETLTQNTLNQLNNFFNNEWSNYNKKIEASSLNISRNYSTLQ